MDRFRWIMSEGGPLICLEHRFEVSWGGVFKLTVAQSGAANDYDRPDDRLDYLQTINLIEGNALIFGGGPLDTAFWSSSNGTMFLIRILCCEEDIDFEAIMNALHPRVFANPREILEFSFATSNLVLFDSADAGSDKAKSFVTASIQPGRYSILTQPMIPTPAARSCSIVSIGLPDTKTVPVSCCFLLMSSL